MDSFHGLTVDLSALVSNWRYIGSHLNTHVECSAVVKADAYGVGVKEVVSRLLKEGCRQFFVANLEEALQIKPLLSQGEKLFVLSGCKVGEEAVFLREKIIPVIISISMFNRWLKVSRAHKALSPCSMVKINTGMNRLGLDRAEWQRLLNSSDTLQLAGVRWLMSHLACADEPEHRLNKIQLQRFNSLVDETRKVLPECKFSLANSAGVFLGEAYHFDLVRPGIALYGGQPQIAERAIKPLVYLNLEVLQARALKPGECVGYGAR